MFELIFWVGLFLFGTLGVVVLIVERRRRRQATVLWLLTVAVDKELPLVEELEAYAASIKGRHKGDIEHLADMLTAGEPLPDAMAFARRLFPRDAVLAAQMGRHGRPLAEALRSAAVRHMHRRSTRRWGPASISAAVLYLWGVATVLASIMTFTNYYIMPKFKRIFEDFDTELPSSTWELIAFVDTWYGVLGLVSLGLFVVLGLAATTLLRGWSEIDVPHWAGRWLKRLDTPGLLRNLALSVRAGRPMDRTLAIVGEFHPRRTIRQAASRARVDCEAGDPWWEVLRDYGLIGDREAELLRGAADSGNLSWALDELAETIAARQFYRWASAYEVVHPLLVVALGVAVFFVARAYFEPLVVVINNLS
ncbi:MAG: type II secretion system F family protein [Planctomycetes bacterium]|nr:type II secretion system F family protein [Planctomycetota bacterium]